MALSITIPGENSEVLKVARDDPRMPILTVQGRQQSKRLRKLRKGTRGEQHNWLLWWVTPISPEIEFDEWLTQTLARKVTLLPESVYRVAIEGLIDRQHHIPLPTDGIFCWEIDDKHRIAALPDIGLIGFFAPPGNLRKAIDPTKSETSWNWSFAGVPFCYDEENGAEASPTKSEYGAEFRKKFGSGNNSVIGIIDSGICKNCTELEGRVIATWAMVQDYNGVPRPDYGANADEIGHGTEAATIAAGSRTGIARHAKIFSLKIPMRREGGASRYFLFDLAAAFGTLQSEHAPTVNGKSALSLIDTLLLPNGIYLPRKRQADANITNIVKAIAMMNSIHDIVIVAAIGNQPGVSSFPADEANVLSVGAIDGDGSRWGMSGWGKDSTGRDVPVIHFHGTAISCQSLNGTVKQSTGTSMAAAGVAGVVALLKHQYPTSRGRWQFIRNNISTGRDNLGPLPIFSFQEK